MDGQAGYRQPSARYPYLRDDRAADGTACNTNTLTSVGPAKTFDPLYHSAAKHPELVRSRPFPQRQLTLHEQLFLHINN